MGSDPRQVMLETNARQKAYYERASGAAPAPVNGLATNLWRRMRRRALDAADPAQRGRIYQIHRRWLGDLSGKGVLELGCGSGSALSEFMAKNSREYHAIDLSKTRVDALAKRLEGLPSVVLHVGDYLADDFAEGGFDVIYAHSVAHHFRFFTTFCEVTSAKLGPGGTLVTYDPLQTWAPVRALRAVYRRFQTDAEWEWPFDDETIRELGRHFDVVERFGVYGKVKWAMALGVVNPHLGRRLARRWSEQDMSGRIGDAELRRCLHVSFLLKKKD
jgi:SAM-dependent methyltransferase